MRVLLVHPEDSPSHGPWSGQRWDLVVDLGKSSEFSAEAWGQQFRCRVVRADTFRYGISDAKEVRQLFSAGRGKLIDEEGIDWWDLLSLLLAPDALALLAFQRVMEEIPSAAECWATRPGVPTRIVEILLRRKIRRFGQNATRRLGSSAKHYGKLFRRFSIAQIKQILLDKYDSGYRWRSRFAPVLERCEHEVVLLPSAYENVSRMAYAYARLLPERNFLMVATRQSAKNCVAPQNVEIKDLGQYAIQENRSVETQWLLDRWKRLRTDLQHSPTLQVLIAARLMDSFPVWIRDGLQARDAWRQVLRSEPIRAVLCGDDSNLFTRLPVLLAAKRNIPTLDFHHGALDGRYLLKELPSDFYLAKNEMELDYLVRICGLPDEKVVIGAPIACEVDVRHEPRKSGCVIFFSEPYEVGGMRTDEVYREILPALCQIARSHGRSVMVKLHPFESLPERRRTIRELSQDDQAIVTVVDGPLTADLLGGAWFGVTVDSSCVLDCLQSGIYCFLCKWLSLSPFGYTEQYARFGVGEVLESRQEIHEIPSRLERLGDKPAVQFDLSPTVDAASLQGWLTAREFSEVRSAS